jgi:C1A family cysteine protease
MGHAYGWIPDKPDPRDHVLLLSREDWLTPLPAEFSLRGEMPPVFDQGELGSCTANAWAGAVQYQQLRQKESEGDWPSSRLFIYYNERKLEGTVDFDSGASIRDGAKTVATVGAPPETDWPYDIAKFTEKPPAQAFADGVMHTATRYGRVIQSARSLQASIHAHRPVVFGFTVFESFETVQTAETGVIPMPKHGEQILGGHAVVAMGWKPINGNLYFECRNSWSADWGDQGYFWLPAPYITDPNLASDMWHIDLET